ncbi:hypothetical protein [Streptomyces cinereoruber]|uniref:hypothetical protein n=1 Tax=Streptomyces cinereoruber TaxID=67260 RepID=UPI00362BDC53
MIDFTSQTKISGAISEPDTGRLSGLLDRLQVVMLATAPHLINQVARVRSRAHGSGHVITVRAIGW